MVKKNKGKKEEKLYIVEKIIKKKIEKDKVKLLIKW